MIQEHRHVYFMIQEHRHVYFMIQEHRHVYFMIQLSGVGRRHGRCKTLGGGGGGGGGGAWTRNSEGPQINGCFLGSFWLGTLCELIIHFLTSRFNY